MEKWARPQVCQARTAPGFRASYCYVRQCELRPDCLGVTFGPTSYVEECGFGSRIRANHLHPARPHDRLEIAGCRSFAHCTAVLRLPFAWSAALYQDTGALSRHGRSGQPDRRIGRPVMVCRVPAQGDSRIANTESSVFVRTPNSRAGSIHADLKAVTSNGYLLPLPLCCGPGSGCGARFRRNHHGLAKAA